MTDLATLTSALLAKRGQDYFSEFEAWANLLTTLNGATGGLFTATSATSVEVSTGSKSFTLAETGRAYAVGSLLRISRTSDATVYMTGTVTSYSGTSLVVNVTDTGGTGTYDDWSVTINLDVTFASQAEAETGTNNTLAMTPLRTVQAITARTGTDVGDLLQLVDVSGGGSPQEPGLPAVAVGGLIGLGGFKLIASAMASNDATVDFTSGINSDHDQYLVIGMNVIPATDNRLLGMRTSSDGGSSFASTSGDYASNITTTAGSANIRNVQTASVIEIADGVGNNANETGVCFMLTINKPSFLQYCQTYHKGTIVDGSGNIVQLSGAGLRKTAAAINGVRFFFDSGNIQSGEFYLYGVRKS